MTSRLANFKRLVSIMTSSLVGVTPPGAPAPVTEADLPAEVRDGYLNKPCCCDQGTIIPYQTCKSALSEDTSACIAACPPNPNVTCQLDGQKAMTYIPGHIGNAEKGDLLLCPATSNGLIGALL